VEGLSILQLQNVSRCYKEGDHFCYALKKINLSFPDTGFVAITGKSGSGKSTLLNIVSLLEKPSTGQVYYDKKELSSFSEREKEDFRNFTYGFLFQSLNLLKDEDAYYNVSLPLLIRDEKGIRKKVLSLFKQFHLENLLHKKVGLLSGGEGQRVALLRALVGGPEVILADEPTGALDKKNALLVMESLREVSQDHLVIMVSHNEALVDEFASRVISLQDGAVISDISKKQETGILRLKKKRLRGMGKPFVFHLLKDHLKTDKARNGLALLASICGFCPLLLSLGFQKGSAIQIKEASQDTLLYYQASLLEKKNYKLEGSPLSLTKATRPDKDNLKNLLAIYPSLSYAEDYSYFFPSSGPFVLGEDEKENTSFSPLFDESLESGGLSLLVSGRTIQKGSFSECLVNEEFLKRYGDEAMNKTLHRESVCSVTDLESSDTISLASSFKIVGVVKEFPFLSSPRVYYSYAGLTLALKEKELPHLTFSYGREVTVTSLVVEASEDSAYSSYAYFIYGDGEALKSLYQKLEDEGTSLSLSSVALSTQEAFQNLSSSLSASLLPFIIMELAGVIFISGALSYSSFLERKKEAAILFALGARKNDVAIIYVLEAGFVSLLSMVLSLLLTIPLSGLLNYFLNKKTFLENLISLPYLDSYLGIPSFILLVSLLGSFLLGALSSYLPFLALKKTHLSRELAEE
jgi:putative ABC transport system permease protein